MRLPVLLFAAFLAGFSLQSSSAETLTLRTRSRVKDAAEPAGWKAVEGAATWDSKHTAVVVCDMWDKHWCPDATDRVGEMAPVMNKVISSAREKGVFIIHCPSDTMGFYTNHPGRKLAQAAPKVETKVPLKGWCSLTDQKEPPLPIDDSDGGCDGCSDCKQYRAWSRQHAAIEIKDGDAITDSTEAFYLMKQRGITNVIVMGVHANMCVLGRPFSIRQMVAQGQNVLLMRDMTDSMYHHKMRPFVSHFRGTELVVEHIEQYWCPSITSTDFIGGSPFKFKEDKQPHVVCILGENEYHTWETLPPFLEKEVASRGIKVSYVNAPPTQGSTAFTNWQVIKDADLLVVSARRRTPPIEMMNLIKAHVAAGKPVAGIRTASHAFAAKPSDSEHGAWFEWDHDVLGGDYQGHFANKPDEGSRTVVQAVAGAISHPVLTGVGAGEFKVNYHLYKNPHPASTITPLMRGHVEGDSEQHPVAWVYTGNSRRVFYTSLGGVDDFQQPFFRRLLLNGILWSLDLPIPPAPKQTAASPPAGLGSRVQTGPIAPAESAAMMRVPDDLEIEQVLAEPIVKQPVFLNFDERGRMWVVQYLQYPHPAGLKMVSRDNVWRAVYDKVPLPPPSGVKGMDKITIHEDTDGDGKFDSHKTFVDGLNIATSLAHDNDGVWVLNPPYLLFYKDANHDDIPDGDPEVHLAGFGLEDTHSVANSLCWGPDSWLYGCLGSTVTSAVTRPGLDKQPVARTMGQHIWRYHPATRRFEVFSEGGGNAFGLEFDAVGRVFSGHNGGNTRGFHYMQGAWLQKGFDKHGPLSNPNAFGYFPAMSHPDVERFTHDFVFYEGDGLPEKYRGLLFGVEPLQGRVVMSVREPDHSTFRTRDIGHAVTSGDKWFKPVHIQAGPDGALYICDWYDQQVNHFRNHEGQIDRDNGRIYRLKSKGAKTRLSSIGAMDTAGLANLLASPDKVARREARRLLVQRGEAGAAPMLRAALKNDKAALESLWVLHGLGMLDDALLSEALHHPRPEVRTWAVRFIGDDPAASQSLISQLVPLAVSESDLETRCQLASTARRVPPAQGLAVAKALAGHAEDASDPRQPLLIWWALEARCEKDADAVLGLFKDGALWSGPLAQGHLLGRLMRRFAAENSAVGWRRCEELLKMAPGLPQRKALMAGFDEAFKGRAVPPLPGTLALAISESGAESLPMAVRRGGKETVSKGIAALQDPATPPAVRLQLALSLGDVRASEAAPVLMTMLRGTADTALQRGLLASLQWMAPPDFAALVIEKAPVWTNDVRSAAFAMLASREAWAGALVRSLESGGIEKSLVQREVVSSIRKTLGEKADWGARLTALFGPGARPSTAEMESEISRLRVALGNGSGNPYAGQLVFQNTCGSCHRLFNQGGEVGPNLTSFKRDDLETLLLNIVNPNAEIREGYESFNLETKDDRSLTGFIHQRDGSAVVLRGLDGTLNRFEAADIASLKPAGQSIMPEGLLTSMPDQSLRDLFAYLRSSQPLVK